jgi:DNA-binding LytR/AlgR family response regulator
MNKVKVLIVEDEMIISADIKNCLVKTGYDVIGQATNYKEAVAIFQASPPDITLLDIQMPGQKNGINLAHKINQDFKTPFIFLTANSDSDTIEKAKITEPSAYLIKPFNKKELVATIEIALFNFSKRLEKAVDATKLVIKDSLFLKKEKKFFRIDFKDILFIKSDHVYLDLFMANGKKHSVRGTLNDYENKLSSSFFRSHRSYIVNTDYLTGINHNEINILEHTVPVGKKNREHLITLLNIG